MKQSWKKVNLAYSLQEISLWDPVVQCSSLQSFLQLCNAADLKLNLMYFPGTGVSYQHGRDWVRASQRDLLQCQCLEHSCQCHPSGVISVYFHQENHLLGDPSQKLTLLREDDPPKWAPFKAYSHL